MNKKVNTLLFVIGATIFNMLTTIACFIALLVLYSKVLIPIIPEKGQAWGLPLIFIAAIAVSFVIYRLLIKLLMNKIPVDKYFDPIFSRRRK